MGVLSVISMLLRLLVAGGAGSAAAVLAPRAQRGALWRSAARRRMSAGVGSARGQNWGQIIWIKTDQGSSRLVNLDHLIH